jgi:predicted phosphoribosyltransferase
MRFRDRHDAGRHLAAKLRRYAGREVIVLALPRGGVPVGYEVARALDAPLDVFLVRKLGLPGHEELAIGAIASGGVRVHNQDAIRAFGVSQEEIDQVAARERQELTRRERAYRDDRPPPDLRDRIVILVDDGLATGASMAAAAAAVRKLGPGRVVIAVPVGAADTCRAMRSVADEVVCALTPEPFFAVGAWYEDFEQTSDEEVSELLRKAGDAVGTRR